MRQRAQPPAPQTEPAVRSYAVTHPAGTVVVPQPAGWDQLVHASSGVMTVRTADARWVVPRHRAVWVPSGVGHTIELGGRVKLRSLYLRAGLAGLAGDGARPVNVTPLLRELILQAVADAPLWLDRPRDARLVGVLVDHLELLDDIPLQLPTPIDPRAVAVADAILADPGGPAPLAALARDAGASVRTVERLFRAETTMTVQQWRSRARLLAGLELLASGASVTAAAVRCGYSSPSAFGAAFKAELGVSPRAYVAGP
jgi:AraC-like DNA-binding protein